MKYDIKKVIFLAVLLSLILGLSHVNATDDVISDEAIQSTPDVADEAVMDDSIKLSDNNIKEDSYEKSIESSDADTNYQKEIKKENTNLKYDDEGLEVFFDFHTPEGDVLDFQNEVDYSYYFIINDAYDEYTTTDLGMINYTITDLDTGMWLVFDETTYVMGDTWCFLPEEYPGPTTVGHFLIEADFVDDYGIYQSTHLEKEFEITKVKSKLISTVSDVNVGEINNFTVRLIKTDDSLLYGEKLINYTITDSSGSQTKRTISSDNWSIFRIVYQTDNPGEVKIDFCYEGDDMYEAFNTTLTYNVISQEVTKKDVNIDLSVLNDTEGNVIIKGQVTDDEGLAISNKNVIITVSNNTMFITTDQLGEFDLNLDLLAGQYTIIASTTEDDSYNKATKTLTYNVISQEVTKKDVNIDLSVLNDTEGNVIIKGHVTDDEGLAISNKNVIITFSNNTMIKTTDQSGEFDLNLNLLAGQYTIIASTTEDDSYNKATKNLTFEVVSENEEDDKLDLFFDIHTPEGDVLTASTDDYYFIIHDIDDENTAPEFGTITFTITNMDTLEDIIFEENIYLWEGETWIFISDNDYYGPTEVGHYKVSAVFVDESDLYKTTELEKEFEIAKVKTKITINTVNDVNQGEENTFTARITKDDGSLLSGQKIITSIITDNENTIENTLTSDSFGIFTINYQTNNPGLVQVILNYEGDENYELATATVSYNVIATQTKSDVNINLNTINNTINNVEISGTLTDENGLALADQIIQINLPDESILIVLTDENGLFTTALDLPLGLNTILVLYNGNENYNPNSQELTIDVIKEASLIDLTTISDYIADVKIGITVTNPKEEAVTGENVKVYKKVGDQLILLSEVTLEDDTTIVPLGLKAGQYDIVVVYDGNEVYEANEAMIELNVAIKDVSIDINLDDIKTGDYTFKAVLTDENNNPVNGGKVVFKVNGITLKDENNKIIYAKVEDGIAKIEDYNIPDSWAQKELNVEVVYSGSTKYNSAKTTANTTINSQPTVEITPFTEAVHTNSQITIKVKVSDNSKAITTGKIVLKLNGKTLKDENGKVMYLNLDENGEVSIDYLLQDLKAKTYKLTAVFSSSAYSKVESETNITVVK